MIMDLGGQETAGIGAGAAACNGIGCRQERSCGEDGRGPAAVASSGGYHGPLRVKNRIQTNIEVQIHSLLPN